MVICTYELENDLVVHLVTGRLGREPDPLAIPESQTLTAFLEHPRHDALLDRIEHGPLLLNIHTIRWPAPTTESPTKRWFSLEAKDVEPLLKAVGFASKVDLGLPEATRSTDDPILP